MAGSLRQIEDAVFIYDGHGQTFLSTLYTFSDVFAWRSEQIFSRLRVQRSDQRLCKLGIRNRTFADNKSQRKFILTKKAILWRQIDLELILGRFFFFFYQDFYDPM